MAKNKPPRDLFAQAREYVRQIDTLEKEITKQKREIAKLHAIIEESKIPIKKRVLTAIDDGARTTIDIAKVTKLKLGTVQGCVYRLYALGVIRRRGPYALPKTGGTQFFYGRVLDTRRASNG